MLWATMTSPAAAMSVNFGPVYVRFEGEAGTPADQAAVANLIIAIMSMFPDDNATICSIPSSSKEGAKRRAIVRDLLIAGHIAPSRLETIEFCKESWMSGKDPKGSVMVILNWLKSD
ncbi:hypothetical protein [Sphingobium fontiphilum]|nr:hypothetical protein [Sphingobium fontiphilum]